MASLVLVALVVVVLAGTIAIVQRAKAPREPVALDAPPIPKRSISSRLGALLMGCGVLVAITGCRLDIAFLPQRWSLSDDPLPPWFFGPLGLAWNYGLPLAVLLFFGAGLVLVWRGGAV